MASKDNRRAKARTFSEYLNDADREWADKHPVEALAKDPARMARALIAMNTRLSEVGVSALADHAKQARDSQDSKIAALADLALELLGVISSQQVEINELRQQFNVERVTELGQRLVERLTESAAQNGLETVQLDAEEEVATSEGTKHRTVADRASRNEGQITVDATLELKGIAARLAAGKLSTSVGTKQSSELREKLERAQEASSGRRGRLKLNVAATFRDPLRRKS
jgi:hypothetical protein